MRRWNLALGVVLVATVTGGGQGAASTATPRLLRSLYTHKREVALTFDDGPSPYTPQVLATLRRFHVHATFFLIGEQVKAYPQYVKAEAADRDELGNHTYSHPDMAQLNGAAQRWQLTETNALIRHASGIRPHWWRPPYVAVNPSLLRLAAGLSLHTITWSVDPQDWALPGTAAIVQRVLSAVKPGSVILLHDGGGNRAETVAALPRILRGLHRLRYRPVRLGHLFFPRARTRRRT